MRQLSLPLVGLLLAITPASSDPAAAAKNGVVVCLQINATGGVSDGFILKSSGDTTYDEDMLAGAKRLNWGGSEGGRYPRPIWIPIGLGEAGVASPEPTKHCAGPSPMPKTPTGATSGYSLN
jgi:hypothetical protein